MAVTPEMLTWFRARANEAGPVTARPAIGAVDLANLVDALEECRRKNVDLTRRSQAAESAVAKEIAKGPGDRTLGRALANVAAVTWKERAERAESALEVAREALDAIASWGEGPEVDGGFDEPWSAREARAALSKLPPREGGAG